MATLTKRRAISLKFSATPKEEKLILDLLNVLNLKIENIDENDDVKPSASEIKKAISACSGMWKDNPVSDFKEFRKQAWGGRGV